MLTLGMTPKAIEKALGIRLRYLDNLVNLHCASDLLALGLFPDIKEVTESFAAYRAVLDFLTPHGWRLGDPGVTVIAVGDGAAPRTAATFAHRSSWECISVDPRMKAAWLPGGHRAARVQRLTCHRARIEDVEIVADRALIVRGRANLLGDTQAAYSAGDLAKMRALATPEMLATN